MNRYNVKVLGKSLSTESTIVKSKLYKEGSFIADLLVNKTSVIYKPFSVEELEEFLQSEGKLIIRDSKRTISKSADEWVINEVERHQRLKLFHKETQFTCMVNNGQLYYWQSILDWRDDDRHNQMVVKNCQRAFPEGILLNTIPSSRAFIHWQEAKYPGSLIYAYSVY